MKAAGLDHDILQIMARTSASNGFAHHKKEGVIFTTSTGNASVRKTGSDETSIGGGTCHHAMIYIAHKSMMSLFNLHPDRHFGFDEVKAAVTFAADQMGFVVKIDPRNPTPAGSEFLKGVWLPCEPYEIRVEHRGEERIITSTLVWTPVLGRMLKMVKGLKDPRVVVPFKTQDTRRAVEYIFAASVASYRDFTLAEPMNTLVRWHDNGEVAEELGPYKVSFEHVQKRTKSETVHLPSAEHTPATLTPQAYIVLGERYGCDPEWFLDVAPLMRDVVGYHVEHPLFFLLAQDYCAADELAAVRADGIA
jgi:hypothetical protein